MKNLCLVSSVIAATFATTLYLPDLSGSEKASNQGVPALKPRIRLSHDEGLFAIVLTPDGRTVVTGGQDSNIHLWNATNGQKKCVLSGHEGNVVDLAIDRDGNRLASVGYDGIRLWHLPTATFERLLPVKRGSITWIRFAPDGRTLASGALTREIPIQLWDAATGQELAPLPLESAGSRCAAFSPDGRKIVASNSMNTRVGQIKIWDLATRQSGKRISVHRNDVRRVEFTPDGKGIITADLAGQVVVWNSESGGPLSIRIPDHQGEIAALAVSRDGSTLGTSSRGEKLIRCWELATGKELSRLEGHKDVIKSIAFSTNGTIAVSAGFDGTALIWRTVPSGNAVGDSGKLTLADGEALWTSIAGDDALSARQAIDRLAKSSEIAVRLASSRLRPLSQSDHERIEQRVEDLDHTDVAIRRDAMDELMEFGDLAELSLRKARANRWLLMFRQRVDVVLEAIQKQPASAIKRTNLRGIQLLEQIGDAKAVELLAKLAGGTEDDVCTIAAIASLQRLGKLDIGIASSNRSFDSSDQATSISSFRQNPSSGDNERSQVDAGAVSLAAEIDRLIEADWQGDAKVEAPIADDFEWIRRVTLDLTGRIPLAYEVQDFVDDRSTDKRQQLIDRLIESPEYVERQIRIWRMILVGSFRIDERFTRSKSLVPAMERWLNESFKNNRSYDQIVHSLLTTPIVDERQETYQRQSTEVGTNPLGFYFRQDDLSPEVVAGEVSRVFLGVKLECARCHDHPFADWKRQQFWEFAAFFSGIRASKPSDTLFPMLHGEDPDQAALKLPESNEVVTTHFFDGTEPQRRAGVSTRQLLADWMTSPDNPYFARTVVNRVWAEFFGAGLVEPVDDLNVGKASGRQELIDLIARRFVARKYDLKFLNHAIALTRAYQRTSRLTHDGQQREYRLAKFPVRSLTGEQIYDSLICAAASDRHIPPMNEAHKQQMFGMSSHNDLVRRFSDVGPRSQTETSLVDALFLMNGPFINKRLQPLTDETLDVLVTDTQSTLDAKLDALFLATLSRYPQPDEAVRMKEFLQRSGTESDLKSQFADAFWALLNSSEFLSNH